MDFTWLVVECMLMLQVEVPTFYTEKPSKGNYDAPYLPADFPPFERTYRALNLQRQSYCHFITLHVLMSAQTPRWAKTLTCWKDQRKSQGQMSGNTELFYFFWLEVFRAATLATHLRITQVNSSTNCTTFKMTIKFNPSLQQFLTVEFTAGLLC